jgi:hypothetical protein
MTESDILALDAQLAMTDGVNRAVGFGAAGSVASSSPQGAVGGPMQKLVDIKTYVNGRDISAVSAEELVGMIKLLEKEQDDLAKISTESRALNARKAEITNALTVLASRLDALYDLANPEAAQAAPAPTRARR